MHQWILPPKTVVAKLLMDHFPFSVIIIIIIIIMTNDELTPKLGSLRVIQLHIIRCFGFRELF